MRTPSDIQKELKYLVDKRNFLEDNGKLLSLKQTQRIVELKAELNESQGADQETSDRS